MKLDNKDIIIVLLSVVVVLVYLVKAPAETVIKYQCQDGQVADSIELCPVEEEVGLLDAVVYSWGENYYNSEEFVFTVSLYNFGYAEARNVEIACKVWQTDTEGSPLSDNPNLVVTENVGNIASVSYESEEIIASKGNLSGWSLEKLIAVCSVNSCDNCEILMDRIQD